MNFDYQYVKQFDNEQKYSFWNVLSNILEKEIFCKIIQTVIFILNCIFVMFE